MSLTDDEYDALKAAFTGRLEDLIAEFRQTDLELCDIVDPIERYYCSMLDELYAEEREMGRQAT